MKKTFISVESTGGKTTFIQDHSDAFKDYTFVDLDDILEYIVQAFNDRGILTCADHVYQACFTLPSLFYEILLNVPTETNKHQVILGHMPCNELCKNYVIRRNLYDVVELTHARCPDMSEAEIFSNHTCGYTTKDTLHQVNVRSYIKGKNLGFFELGKNDFLDVYHIRHFLK